MLEGEGAQAEPTPSQTSPNTSELVRIAPKTGPMHGVQAIE